MANTNNDDFWNEKSNDSFWNETVIKEDTNEQNHIITNNSHDINTNNPFSQNSFNKTAVNDNPISDNTYYENPYVENEYHSNTSRLNDNSNGHGMNETFYTETSSIDPNLMDTAKSKTGHLQVQTIVRLVFVLITVFFLLILFGGSKVYEKIIQKTILTMDYKESTDENNIITKHETLVVMPKSAYTVLQADSTIGLPDGEKMILIPIENVVDKYVAYDRNYRIDAYIGYKGKKGTIYKLPLNVRNFYPFILNYNIPKERMINAGGLSYYCNCKGFYSFFIPKDTQTVDFYIEESNKKFDTNLTSNIYKVTIDVKEADNQVLQEIIQEDD